MLKEVAYYRPETIEAAIEMLRSNPDARILAGGQSLLNVMKHRIASPEVLVDLGGMPELSYVEVEEDSSVEIGAMTTYDDLDRSEQLRRSRPVVAEVASGLVDQQVRNRGTIGGNLCYSDPTSNLPPLMVALEASLVVAGPGGVREVSAEDFFRGPYFTDLRSGEVLTAVRVPPSEHGEGDGYASLRLSAHGWGLAHAATVVRLADGEVAEARISLGCVADRPVRATQMEEALRGRRPTEEALREATEVVEATLDPITDVHATGSYRAKMAGVVARRAVEQAVERTGG